MKEENDAIKGASSSLLIFLFALLVVPPDGDPVLRLVQVVPAWTNKKFMSLNQWWGRQNPDQGGSAAVSGSTEYFWKFKKRDLLRFHV